MTNLDFFSILFIKIKNNLYIIFILNYINKEIIL